MKTRKVFVQGNEVRFVYSDHTMAALQGLGVETVRRASHVEPTKPVGYSGIVLWEADMSPVEGGKRHFVTREDALAWEVEELEKMGAPFPKEGH